MPSKRRARLEIIRDLLKVLTEETRPTHIMHASNTSWKYFQEVLSELTEGGYAVVIENTDLGKRSRKNIVITTKGRDKLRQLTEVTRI